MLQFLFILFNIQKGLRMNEALVVCYLLRMYYTRRINVRQMMLALLHQLFCVPDPAAGLACTGRFIVSQVIVQRFNEPDSFTQGNAKGLVSLQTKLLEVLHALIPTAIARSVAMITAFAGGLEHIVFGVVAALDELFDHLTGIQKRFYELLSHWRSPLNCTSILGRSGRDLNRTEGHRRK